VIRSFRNRESALVFARQYSRQFDSIKVQALRKLLLIDAAPDLRKLAIPPGNHLEALKGDRAGQHSIRINDQWRICFVWKADGAHDVEIVDYH
jgi:proteic killer suppression protein